MAVNIVSVSKVVFSLMLLSTSLSSNAFAEQTQENGAIESSQSKNEAQIRVISRFGEREGSTTEASIENAQPSNTQPSNSEFEANLEQSLLASHPVIQQAIDDRQWVRAHQLVSQQSASHSSATRAAYWKFLEGYTAYQAKRFPQAISAFKGLEYNIPILADYTYFYRADSAYEIGDFHQAVLDASNVSERSRLYPQSLVILARALVEAGSESDLIKAEEIMRLYLGIYLESSSAVRIYSLLADTYEKQKKWDKAAEQYLLLRNRFPSSTEATTARQRTNAIKDKLSMRMRSRVDEPSRERDIRRFRALFDRHRSDSIIEQLPSLIETWPAGTGERCEGLFLIGRSYTKLRQHRDSISWYQRVINECKHSDFHIRALYLGGRGHWNAGQRAHAMEWFEKIWTQYPDHSFADDAMFFSARILRDEGNVEASKQLLKKQVATYPDGDMAKDAHWLMLREMFEQKAYASIVNYVDNLNELGEDDIYTRGRLHYFRARAIELDNQNDNALLAYQDVIANYPKTYYALLAFHRIAIVQKKWRADNVSIKNICALGLGAICDPLTNPVGHPTTIKTPAHLTLDKGYQLGKALLILGLSDESRREFARLQSTYADDADVLWAIASYLDTARSYPLSHDIPRRLINNWVMSYPSPDTRRKWEVAFPIPFNDLVTRYASQRNLPNALVYAIMREESGFNPVVESWANARGLLQLMEPVAKNMAQKDGLGPIVAAELLNPELNIRLGTALLEELSGQLNRHPALVIAGYNGGYGNVARWVREQSNLPLDLWVEEIPFGQTRNYTKRVLTSYWAYSLLYDGVHVPVMAFSLD